MGGGLRISKDQNSPTGVVIKQTVPSTPSTTFFPRKMFGSNNTRLPPPSGTSPKPLRAVSGPVRFSGRMLTASGRPPPYAFVTRVYKRTLRPVVIFITLITSIWALVWCALPQLPRWISGSLIIIAHLQGCTSLNLCQRPYYI